MMNLTEKQEQRIAAGLGNGGNSDHIWSPCSVSRRPQRAASAADTATVAAAADAPVYSQLAELILSLSLSLYFTNKHGSNRQRNLYTRQ